MPSLNDYINDIETAVYGRQVRSAIANGLRDVSTIPQNSIRFDIAQALTSEQKERALENIGASPSGLINTVSDLQDTVAEEFSMASAYAPGDYVYHEGLLYKFIANHGAGTAWDSSKVTQVTVADALENIDLFAIPQVNTKVNQVRNSIVEDFTTAHSYAIGDYCYYAGVLYRFKAAHASGAAWNGIDVDSVQVMNRVKIMEKTTIPALDGRITQNEAAISSINGEIVDINEEFSNKFSNIFCDYRIIDDEVVTIYGYTREQTLGNDKRTEKLHTKPGDKWLYHGKAGYQVAAVVFYSGETVIGYETTDDAEKTVVFTAPSGCDYVAFSSYRANYFNVVPVSEKIGLTTMLTEDVSDIFGGYRVISGEVISVYDGRPSASNLNHAKRTNIIHTRAGDTWAYYGRGDYQVAAAAYYKNGVFQSFDRTTGDAVVRTTFTVPSECNGIAFSSYYNPDFDVAPTSQMTGKNLYTSYSPNWIGKKWCAIGDSITEKYSGEFASVKQYWQHIIDETGITFVNCATSGRGYKNADDVERQDAFYQKANVSRYPDLADADVITVYGSVNDCFKNYTIGDVTDTGTSTICGCVNTTLDNLYVCNPAAVIGIITPCPTPGMNPNDDTCEMARICAKIVEICRLRGIPCLDLYHQSGLHPWDSDFRSMAYINGDGTHPNDIGHKIMYPHFREFIKTLI